MKKMLAVLLTLLIACSLSFALAEEAPTVYTSGDYKYVLLEDGTAEITDYKGRAKELIIPSELDGYRVTAIGVRAFCYCTSLTSVSIPDSVTSIGDYAFAGCNSLTSVSIPNSVTSIGNEAFYECKSLASVSIPDSVTAIGDEAFAYCFSLTSISIPDSVTSIGNEAFFECTSLASVSIPDSVTSIGDFAFSYCDSLTSVSISDSVTAIGDRAFYKCTSLTSISIPDSVTVIGDEAFAYCTSLTSISIPDSVTSIGEGAFYYRSRTRLSVSVVRGSYAEEWALAQGYTCTYMKPSGQPYGDLVYRVQADGTILIVLCETVAGRVDIPAAIDGVPVTAIQACAFADCTTLRGVSIPASVTAIGKNAFEGCSNVTFTVERDSYAAQWCQSNNLPFVYPDSYDWLLN